EDFVTLNRKLILSHAVGVGSDLPEEVIRAAMLIRANTLASGYSGVRPVIIETLLQMLNKGVTPAIPSQGSLGSSGDLAPLSHLALVFTTDSKDSAEDSGWANYQGKLLTGKAAMKAADIPRVILGPKESLGITNGATFSAGLGALTIAKAHSLLANAEIALAMSFEALCGTSAAYDKRIHEVRRQVGQAHVAARVRMLIEGSSLIDTSKRVQDSYSLRCAPQIQGPIHDTLTFVEGIISNEINAATDNPLLFAPGEAISGGNFHGEPVAMAMDYLKIALSELGAVSERRTYHLTDGKFNSGLPAMLVGSDEDAGLNSGLMMPQYTAASLVLENQGLASPNSIHSLPTSGGKEDHNANSMTAARNAYQIIENCTRVIAIELFTAARAVDLRLKDMPDSQLGKGTKSAYDKIRKIVPFKSEDSWWAPDIEKINQLIQSESL
ncbi:MAG: aromatic amino acid lyase, partial [Chloroflexota bacterium]